MKHTEKKRDAFAAEIRREVRAPRLVAAMLTVMQARRERAGLGADFRLDKDPEQMLHEFMQASSMRQLKLLREIALAIKFDSIVPVEPGGATKH